MRRSSRKAVTAGVVVASAALLAGIVPGSATASPGDAPDQARTLQASPRAGALTADLSPQQRAKLLKKAEQRREATASALDLGAEEKLVPADVVRDRDGAVHTRYQRTYAGLPVLGGDLVVHTPASGSGRSATYNTRADLKVPTTTPKVAKGKAADVAVRAAESVKRDATEAGSTRKVVWAATGDPVLAWETVVEGMQDSGIPSALHVITDAVSGKKLYQYEGIHSGVGHSQYSGDVTLSTTQSGSSYELTDATRGGHSTYDLGGGTSGTGTLFTDADDVWGTGSGGDNQTAAVDAAYGAQMTWDYYEDVHGRSGIRGDGTAAYSRVHYGNEVVNAYWSDSCFCMSYGDGENGNRPLTSLDVAGHEMTHGVTSVTADLIYSGESGGLNEATSDILGTAMEFHTGNSEDVGDYLIGEEVDIFGNGDPLRYMDEPSKDGSSKDYWYDGIGGVDVHYSSGPANHFFYLLSEGSGQKTINGVTYDSPTSDGLPVTGIGRDNAAAIWYRALTTYFTSSTNYHGARAGTLDAAADLFGAGSAAHDAVKDAWAAINVGVRSGGSGSGETFENTTTVAIPDAGSAITSDITVTGVDGNAPSALQVGVDITHTYRGDLVIDLIAPDGTSYNLKSNSYSDSADDVNLTYAVDASSEPANGTWQLQVQDVYSYDTGQLNSWSLTF